MNAAAANRLRRESVLGVGGAPTRMALALALRDHSLGDGFAPPRFRGAWRARVGEWRRNTSVYRPRN
jgi:hypothetical protein